MRLSSRFLALLLAAVMLLLATACNPQPTDPKESESPSESESRSESETESETETETETDIEIESTEGETVLNLTWSQGYIGLLENTTSSYTLFDGAEMYSYSNIFCVKKAGTTIQFLDDDLYAGDNAGKAENNVLVLST